MIAQPAGSARSKAHVKEERCIHQLAWHADNSQEAEGRLWGGLELSKFSRSDVIVWVYATEFVLKGIEIFPNVANDTASTMETLSPFFFYFLFPDMRKFLFCIEQAPLLSLEIQEAKTAQ